MRGADKSKLAVRTAFPAVAPSGSEFNGLSLSCEFVCTMTLLQNEGQGAHMGPPVLCLAITGHLLIRLSGRHPARSAR